MAEDIDYKKLVDDKKSERMASGLSGRMDEDRRLVELGKYALKDVNERGVPNSISVTLNDLGVFATTVESGLGNATEQVIVETEDKNLDTAYIEDVIKASLAAANSRLVRQGKFPLNPYFDQQMCRRGGGAARCLFRMDTKTKTLICDITPWDRRFFYYGMGSEGVDWVAYETFKSKDEIAAEPWAKKEKFTIEDEEAETLDVWTKKKNLIWVNDKNEHEQDHPWGYVPAVFQIVPMGSMMADKESRVARGESIFFLIRDLVPELNRLVSQIATLNQKAVDTALLWKSEEGTAATPPGYEDLSTPGSVTAADIGGGAEAVIYGELKRSAYLLHTMIETRIQRGSLSNLDMGIMGNQPWSAVALMEIGEGRDQVFLPRLGARGGLNQQLAEMLIDQIIQTGATSVEIGSRGHKRTFDARKLVGEYEISFKYFIKSPKTDIARFSMASAAGDLVSEKYKTENILQMEDPEGDDRQKRWEEAERLVPAIKMRRDIKALLEMADRGDADAEEEAKLVSDALGVTVEQLLSGGTEQQPKPEEREKPKPMVPLFGKDRERGGSAGGAAAQGEPGAGKGEG